MPSSYNTRRKRHYPDRPEGDQWFGRSITKRHLLQAAMESKNPDGTINKERFANKVMGFRGGTQGGFTNVRRLSLQIGNSSETESKGKGRRRLKDRS